MDDLTVRTDVYRRAGDGYNPTGKRPDGIGACNVDGEQRDTKCNDKTRGAKQR